MTRIVGAAILKDGVVHVAKRHDLIFRAVPHLQGVQGFITDQDQFVLRTDAARIAREAGQVSKYMATLISEDLIFHDKEYRNAECPYRVITVGDDHGQQTSPETKGVPGESEIRDDTGGEAGGDGG